MLKYVVAVAVFVGGVALPALAQAQAPNDNEQIAKIKQEADRLRTSDTENATPPSERAPYAERQPEAYVPSCANCPPPRHYDNVEVVKSSRDVDQSRVINTQSVVHVPPRVKETNKLLVRENQTRNVGVIQHNHTIIEKEIRYVKRRAPAYRVQTTYQPVLQNGSLVYWIVRRGSEAVIVPAETQSVHRHQSSRCDCSGPAETYSSGYVGQRGYAYGGSSQTIMVPVQVPYAGGYRQY